ncbi:MAG: OsmC family protein [Microbacterium sp.]
MTREHRYALTATWTGNRGTGTSGTRDYDRSVTLAVDGKPDLLGSADRPFFGDQAKWNPEDMVVAALAQCHLLSYLRACVLRGVVVTAYEDAATGSLVQEEDGGRFTEVVLRPRVTVAEPAMIADAEAAHAEAHSWCFIANSVSFPVRHEAVVVAASD